MEEEGAQFHRDQRREEELYRILVVGEARLLGHRGCQTLI
jgi:hypothetical protein